jgi:hypothetical protein
VGSHYLGGSYPPGFHTWSIKTPGQCRLQIVYHSTTDDPPELTPAPLKALRIVAIRSEGRQVVLDLQAIGPEAIVSVYCPKGTFAVDALRVVRLP